MESLNVGFQLGVRFNRVMLKLGVLIRATESLKVRVSVRIGVKVSVVWSLKIRVSGF